MEGDVLSVRRSTRLWAGLESQLAAAKFLNGGVFYWLRSLSFGVVADGPAPLLSPVSLELSFKLHFSLASCQKFVTWIVFILAKNVVLRLTLTNRAFYLVPQLVPFFVFKIESDQERYKIYEQTKAYNFKPFVTKHLCCTIG